MALQELWQAHLCMSLIVIIAIICRRLNFVPRLRTPVGDSTSSLIVIVAIICRRLNFIHPVPLPTGDLNSHRGGNYLLKCIDRRESWDTQTQNDDSRDVEKEVLCFHEKLVVAPDE
eukprot:TRINITY_DN8237_c1_g1_i1.p1 TRINITY_DN8237_c1_g1~~TRINITY_DN8237_c1_g1_i1.p1  ORF type:complete len:116 (+),score=6.55 TRINITY_DN8237_c1_g1_i1:67-414(+)